MSIRENSYMIPLENDAILWRYLNLKKFESLLKEQALFFCRDDKFTDKFEGAIPTKEFICRNSKLSNSKKILYSNKHQEMKKFTLINCWHININESNTMWKIYLNFNEGVAIQTHYNKLKEVLNNAKEMFLISKIRYLDYDKDIWYHKTEFPHNKYCMLTPLIHKRKEFIDEKEFRILYEIDEEERNDEYYWDKQESNVGKFIKIDLKNLIEKIILPPNINSSLKEKIVSLINLYNFNFLLNESKLNQTPFY